MRAELIEHGTAFVLPHRKPVHAQDLGERGCLVLLARLRRTGDKVSLAEIERMNERRGDEHILSRRRRLTVARADKSVPALQNFKNTRIDGQIERLGFILRSDFENGPALTALLLALQSDLFEFLAHGGIEESLLCRRAAIGARRGLRLPREEVDDGFNQRVLVVGRSLPHPFLSSEDAQRR